jgi:hypothetical protein
VEAFELGTLLSDGSRQRSGSCELAAWHNDFDDWDEDGDGGLGASTFTLGDAAHDPGYRASYDEPQEGSAWDARLLASTSDGMSALSTVHVRQAESRPKRES